MQIPLPFPQCDPAEGDDIAYLEGPANASARGVLESWRTSITNAPETLGVIITGATGAGKSRLALETAAIIGAAYCAGPDLAQFLQAPLTGPGYVIDDCDQCAPADLMGLINHCLAKGFPYILTGAGIPATWAGDPALVDLQTRLSALPQALLDLPDTRMMGEALKNFLAQKAITTTLAATQTAITPIRHDFKSAHQLSDLMNKILLSSPGPVNKELTLKIVADHPALKL